jgi:hypothetical protein
VGAADASAGQRLSRVEEVVVRLPPDCFQERHAFARAGERQPDSRGLDERVQPLEAFAPQSRAHLLQQERPNTVELQYFE